jgi:hypothetical protein
MLTESPSTAGTTVWGCWQHYHSSSQEQEDKEDEMEGVREGETQFKRRLCAINIPKLFALTVIM